MMIIPELPRVMGTPEEKIGVLTRYITQLQEALSVYLNVDRGEAAPTAKIENTVIVAAVSSDSNIAYGTFTMTYGTEETQAAVSFGSAFAGKPAVICSQPFDARNVTVSINDVSKTGFTARLPAMDAAGSCTVMYIAAGKAD